MSVRSSSSRPKTSLAARQRKRQMMSVDDGIRDFDFEAFERVMSEMKSGDTTVGGILGAMIYQIEETNKKNMDPIEKQSVGVIKKGS